MVVRVNTIAFQGIEGVPVEVQAMIAPGRVGINIVGLVGQGIVAENRERVQEELHALGLALPAKKVTIKLAPADLPKEGGLGLMGATIGANAQSRGMILSGWQRAGRRLSGSGDRYSCTAQPHCAHQIFPWYAPLSLMVGPLDRTGRLITAFY